MAEVLIQENGIVSLGSVENEEDLKPRPGININPPPKDGRCECCGRHISELKPFGKAGDPLVGDFDGALLVKRWRPDGPYDEEAERAMKNAEKRFRDEGYENPLEWMVNEYGKDKGEQFFFAVELHHDLRKSWECRDCIVLDEEEYFEKLLEHGGRSFYAIPISELPSKEELEELLLKGKEISSGNNRFPR
jgi:hypothetical protein